MKRMIPEMNTRKFLLVILILSALLVGVSTVGAQETTPQPSTAAQNVGPIRTVLNVVADEIGLQPRDILLQMQDGLTLADIITANGGDVNQVITNAVAKLTDEINTAVANGKMTQDRANNLLSNLQDEVTRAINGELFPNTLNRGAVREATQRILVQAVADATHLRPPQILAQLRSGSTLADIITANGGDVDAVVNSAVAAATDQINAAVKEGRLGQQQADQLIANLPDLYKAAVNGNIHPALVQQVVGLAILRLAADQTGMAPKDIMAQLRSGKSLADVLTEHNVDVNTFIDTAVSQTTNRINKAVSNGRLTQDQADQLIQTFRDRLTERIN